MGQKTGHGKQRTGAAVGLGAGMLWPCQPGTAVLRAPTLRADLQHFVLPTGLQVLHGGTAKHLHHLRLSQTGLLPKRSA